MAAHHSSLSLNYGKYRFKTDFSTILFFNKNISVTFYMFELKFSSSVSSSVPHILEFWLSFDFIIL